MDTIKGTRRAFERSEQKTPHLLLVEDDETDVLFIERCLAAHGGNVPLAVARDGAEALDLLSTGSVARPFVILTDLNMPGMSGHELIEEIRSNEMLRDSVIFVLSSSQLAGDIGRAYRNNIAGYITKQAPVPDLTRKVNMIFDYCASVHLPA